MARGAMTALNNCADPVSKPLADELMGKTCDFKISIIQRAVDRGELPKHTDCALIGELFSSLIFQKLLVLGEKVSLSYAESIIDIVIAGANAIAPPQNSKAGRKKVPPA